MAAEPAPGRRRRSLPPGAPLILATLVAAALAGCASLGPRAGEPASDRVVWDCGWRPMP